ncbi:MAG: carbohydrate-binding protein [Clostridiaceae bacterium]|jgi:hypothetical protein|nr:carbohydrate-binding protein [Clostridiaceae bacterium]
MLHKFFKKVLSSFVLIVFIITTLTLSGVGFMSENAYAAINAFSRIEAENFSSINSSTIEQISIPSGGYALGYITRGDYIAYNNIDFGSIGTSAFKVRIATGDPIYIQLRAGSPTGTLLASANVYPTGGYDSYQEISFSTSNITNVIDLYIVFGGPLNFDWFTFTQADTASNTPKNAFSRIEAENFSKISGSEIQTVYTPTGNGLGYMATGDEAIYNNLNFGDGASLFKGSFSTDSDTYIEIRAGSSYGPLVGKIPISSTGDFNTYAEMSSTINAISGVNDIYIILGGPVNIDWFTFAADENLSNVPIITPPPELKVKSAFSQIEAESYDSKSSLYIQTFGIGDGFATGYILPGDSIQFNKIDFSSGAKSFKARVATAESCSLEIRAESLTGSLIGTIPISSTGNWDTYEEISYDVSSITGVQNLYIIFKGYVNIDWFMFTPKAAEIKIDAFKKIQAEDYTNVSNDNISTIKYTPSDSAIAYIQSGNYINFNNVDFGTGALSFKANVVCASGSTTDIQIRLGSTTGTILGTLSVPSTESWDIYNELSCNISNVIGTHNLYLVFTGPINFDWFMFSKDELSASPTPTPTPVSHTNTPTSTDSYTPTPSATIMPTDTIIEQIDINSSRVGPAIAELASIKDISYLQSGHISLNGLGALKGKKEIVLLVDNGISTNYLSINSLTPLDYGIFANRNIRGVGNQAIVKGSVHANNNIESYIANLNVLGSCTASSFTIGYGSVIEGGTSTIAAPLEMPVFHDKLIEEATANSMVFDPSDFQIGSNYDFPGQPGFNIRFESNNTFVITGSGTFNMSSSMYFKGNVRISVPYIINTDSNFLVADGSVNIEGHDINSDGLDEDEISDTTNLLNIYSIHGRIFVATERSKIYGNLYAAGIEGNPLYTHDVGVVLLQGMSNDIYGSVVAGSDVRIEGSSSSFNSNSGIGSKVETKYLKVDTPISSKELTKQIVNSFLGTDTKMSVLQYSDSANLNTFELFDLSQEENAIALENIIDEFPENTTGFSNLGDALRRGYYLLKDSSKSSVDASKYIVVLAANAPNKWTSVGDIDLTPKTTSGTALFIEGDGTIDSDEKSLGYAVTIGDMIKSSGIKTLFVDASKDEISDKIEKVALASDSIKSPIGKNYFTLGSMPDLSTIFKTVMLDPPKNAVLRNAYFEEIFPKGIKLIEGPPGSVIGTEIIDGYTRYKLSANIDINLSYDGTKYKIQLYAMNVKVRPLVLGDITFLGEDSKIVYYIDYIDANGNEQTAFCESNFNSFIMNVFMTIDIS